MISEKDFYKMVARNLAASTSLYKVRAVVHLENNNDIWFWQMILSIYRHGKYKFIGATSGINGNLTSGCTQCLNYLGFLSKRFFVCIDSDFRYLLQERGIGISNGILQTYTYSWENHCAYAESLQKTFTEYCQERAQSFDFKVFLTNYSSVVYEPLIYLLYTLRIKKTGINRTDFKNAIAEHFEFEDEKNNGEAVVERIKGKLAKLVDAAKIRNFDLEKEKERYGTLGLREANAYLYVRGHCLYDYLKVLGDHLCLGTGVDFEQQILHGVIGSCQYDEMQKIESDVKKLDDLEISI